MSSLRLALLVLLGLSVSALASPARTSDTIDAHVLSFVPSKPEVTAYDLKDGLRITFDRDVVGPQEVGKVIAGPALDITPTLAGVARFADRRTLVFVPNEASTTWLPSTSYQVRIANALSGRLGSGVASWPGLRFVYERIRIASAHFEGNEKFQPTKPIAHLTLSQATAAQALAEACRFCPADTFTTRACTRATVAPMQDQAKLPDRRFPITPENDLRRQTRYALRCSAGLRAKQGDAGMMRDFERPFTTYGPAGIAALEPSGGEVASDNVHVTITFATPVDAEQVRTHIQLVDGHGNAHAIYLAGGWEHTTYAWSGNLSVDTDYQIRIKPGLADIFGQYLPSGMIGKFHVGDASPKLRMERGIFVVERSTGRYPIWVRNLAAFRVRCAEVPESRLVAVLTGPSNYDAWWDAGAASSIDYDDLHLRAKERTIRVRGPKNQWHDTALDLTSVCGNRAQTGVYLLEASAETDQPNPTGSARHSLAQVTNLGLVAKVGNASSLVWVVSLATGKPVADAEVRIRDLKGRVRFQGKSNADGVVQAPGATTLLGVKARPAGGDEEAGETFWEDYRARRVVVTARSGDDFAVLDTNWNNGIQVWNFAVNEDRTGGQVRVRGFIHSDRGLYRPGDTVHLKGLARLLDVSGAMTVPTRKERVHLIVKDPRNKVLVDEDVRLSDFGGFHKDMHVSAESPLGDYQVRAEVAGQSFADHFSVEEYRPRTFEVKIRTPKKNTRIGQPLRFDVSANFLYGSPLRGGKLTYSIRRRQHLPEFRGYDEYVFQDYAGQYDSGRYWARYEERSFSDLVSDGEAQLDGKGNARVVVKDKDKLAAPQDYVLQATVSDDTGESVGAGQVVIGHKSSLYLGLHPSECVQAVDMPFGIQVVGFDVEGNRRAASAELEIVRRSYDCGPHGGEGYWSCTARSLAPAIKRTIAVPASGSAAVERVVLKEPGEYVVRVVSDGTGEKAVASDVIWVIGKGEAFWSGDEGDRMTVVASKAKYAPGDTALLVAQAQMPGALALTTLERDGIMSYTLTELATTGQALQVKLTPELAPNAFASVILVRGRTGDGARNRPRFKMGMVDLKVETSAQQLTLDVTTERASYQPGEEVRATVRVTSSSGQPVQAELAIAAADEGVLQIVGFKTPNPMSAFYAPFGLGVESATTWNRLLRGIDPNLDEDEEGGDAGGPEAGRIRSRFMATAYWNPALVTDASGVAKVRFKAPDNLTAFRLMAVAADRGARFGSSDKRFTVAKPLQLIPALPRFLAPGDLAQAAVAVHNNTDAKLDVAVSARIDGLVVQGPTARRARVPAHGYRRVTFDVRAERDGEAKIVLRARAGDVKDAVLLRVPIRQASIPETLVVGEGNTASSSTHPMPALGEVIPGKGGLEVTLDRVGLGRLAEGLSYLVGYPYGCLEQTTSKVVPMIALGELATHAALPGVDTGDARNFVDIGVAKILRHQHDDGGFGLWIGAPAEAHYTATGLWGLSIAKAAGFTVDEEALAKGAAYLRRRPLSAGHGGELLGARGTDAFASYVLANLHQADAGALARLFEERATLPIYGRAFLLRALLAAGRDDLVRVLTKELVALVPSSGAGLIHELPGELGWYWSSDVRTTALVLWALTVAAPGEASLGRLAQALLDARGAGRWGNTQENVFALLALAERAKSGAHAGQITARIRIGDRVVAKKILDGENTLRVSIPLDDLATGPLTVSAEGGPLFYSARLQVLRPMASKATDHGIVIERSYLDPETRAPLASVRLGQQVLVRVRINSPIARAHVAVVDRLPAGFEPVLRRFSNMDAWRGDGAARTHTWRNWRTAWQNEELRDDRMQIFADTLAQGSSEHSYLVRAASTGSFVVPPASAEAMYEPSFWGRTAGDTLEIAP